jgi:hypothetical protein
MLVRGKPLESRAPRLWSVIVTAAALVLIVAVPTITAGPRASEPQESAASETAVLGNGEPRPLAAPGAGSEKTEPKTKKTAEVEPSQSPVDVPIPKDTQGPFAMNMCLSPDGKRIAVAGRITDRHALWDPTDDFFYDQLRYPYAGPLRKAFETKIYVASCPPRLSDYSLLVENHRMSAVLAMAISPKEPYQLAYVSREMRFEFPSDPKKEIPIPRVFYPKPERSRGVLYVVPLSGGAPKAVLTFDDDVAGFPRLYYRLYVTSSLCWNDDASALFYGDRVSVSRISLSGKRDVLYRFDQTQDEQSVHYHCLASKLACRSGGLVEFLDYGGDMDRNGKAWNKVLSVLSMRLVRVAQDGKVVEKRQWPQFPFFNPPLRERS